MENQLRALLEQQLEVQNQKIAEMGNVQQQLLEKLMDLIKERSVEVNDDGSSNLDRNSFKFLPELEFPSFDGTHPRNWVKKCSRYFVLCKIPESQRVDVASIHFTGKAETVCKLYCCQKTGGLERFYCGCL